jgi:hypothetical protein
VCRWDGEASYPRRPAIRSESLTSELGPLFEVGQQHSSPEKRAVDRRRVLLWFAGYRLGTADDCAEGLGIDRLCTRPRVTELVEEGMLMKRPDLPRKSTGKGGTAGMVEITLQGDREARRMMAENAA